MHVAVLGCGRWGTFLAWYAASLGYAVNLWGRHGSTTLRQLDEYRQNDYLQLPDTVAVGDDLGAAVEGADLLLIAISAQGLRNLCRQLASLPMKPLVLCMKGLEVSSGTRLTEVCREELGASQPVALWVGPGHVQDFLRGVPNCMVIDNADAAMTRSVADAFSSPLIRFYYGTDLIGNEIGAAAKNVIGLAAGMLDGLGISSLKGALMARGAREVARLIGALGGSEMTAYGLGHIGDYEATLFSPHSQNRRFGEALVRGETFSKLAEGVPTTTALVALSRAMNVEMPITNAVHAIIAADEDPQTVLQQLFLRDLKVEFSPDAN